MADNIQTIIKFDGKALENKSMDVAHLAPALLSLSDLIKETNRMVNGDRVGIKVFVNADLEQKCFELIINLSLTFWDEAKKLIADEDVKSVKEIADWIGIFGGPTAYGLFWLIKKLKEKKITSTKFTTKDGKNIAQLKIEEEVEPIDVPENVYNMYASPSIKEKALDVLAPLREEGYDSLTFYSKNKDGEREHIKFNENEVPNKDGTDLPEIAESNTHTSIIKTSVRIKKAVYEGNAAWTLIYRQAIQAPIADEEWLASFQSSKILAPPRSTLDVSLEEIYKTNEDGEMLGQASYRVIKIHKVGLPANQQSLGFFENEKDK